MRNPIIAVAVASALGAAWATSAVAAPTAAQADAAPLKLVIAGSSAIRNALQAAIGADLCGGAANLSTFSANAGNNPDFRAYSCVAAAGKPGAGAVVTIYDRSEGGSVIGVGPVVNGTQIAKLNLGPTGACNQAVGTQVCAVSANGANGGVNDSWLPAGGTTQDFVQLGVSDLVPAAFVGGNWGVDYSVAMIGPQPTAAQLRTVSSTLLVEQTFGYFANTTGLGLPAGTKTLDLTKQTVADIFAGNYSDWANVPAATGTGTVTAVSTPIVVCNREAGSGTRTGTAIFLEGQSNCTPSPKTIFDSHSCAPNTPTHNCFTTSDELACVTGAAGAIGYVSIDNYSKIASPTLPVSLSNPGVVPTTTQSALGQYEYMFEASANKNTAHLTGASLTLANFLITELQSVTTTAQSAQVSAIPGLAAANTPTIPLTTVGIVPVSDFSKSGDPCSRLVEFN